VRVIACERAQENSLLLINVLVLRALQQPSPVGACVLHTELLALGLPEVREY
jgi:hypothetical protein